MWFILHAYFYEYHLYSLPQFFSIVLQSVKILDLYLHEYVPQVRSSLQPMEHNKAQFNVYTMYVYRTAHTDVYFEHNNLK